MKRRRIKSILVAIEYPHERGQSGLARAAQLAKRHGARLTLVHCVFDPNARRMFPGLAEPRETIDRLLADRRAGLERLARPLRRRGIKVASQALWDYPAFAGIVREVLRSNSDLVVAETHKHAFGVRLFLTNNDWQLIRLCPAPLLLVRSTAKYGKTRILAAIDPLHSRAKAAHLDDRILELAGGMASAHGGRLDVVHAFVPLSIVIAGGVAEPVIVPVDPRVERRHAERVKRTVERTVRPLRLPQQRLHVTAGQPERVILDTAKRLRTDIIVMGAASRRGIERIFIGSTAEAILDRLPCDVLVVKSPRFRTTVPKRAESSRLLFFAG
jgi:universal stress protein E